MPSDQNESKDDDYLRVYNRFLEERALDGIYRKENYTVKPSTFPTTEKIKISIVNNLRDHLHSNNLTQVDFQEFLQRYTYSSRNYIKGLINEMPDVIHIDIQEKKEYICLKE